MRIRSAAVLASAAAALVAALGSVEPASPGGGSACGPRWASSAYAASVDRAVVAGSDVWGERLLSAPEGPTYRAAQGFLAPLLDGIQRKLQPLTSSGVYYVPLSFPWSSYGPTVFSLHVADGSEILTRRATGASISIDVGGGGERYGSCVGRLTPARLAGGYLPIMQTSYTDRRGVRYRQESFVGRVFGARSVVSLVRLEIDARRARRAAVVRFVPQPRLAARGVDRAGSAGGVRLVVSAGGRFRDGAFAFTVPAGGRETLYAVWLDKPSTAVGLKADAETYEAARRVVTEFWGARIAQGMQVEVPDPAVENAQRAVLEQAIAYGWRYSVGNPYEEFSFAEGLDSAEVTAAYGHPEVARAILDYALHVLRRRPKRFTVWRGGHLLSTAAYYFQLTHDRRFVREETGALAGVVRDIAARQVWSGPARGRVRPEPLSSDIPFEVDGVTAPIAAWQGLLAIERVWAVTGYPELAARARTLALELEVALRPAVQSALRRLPDGSLFLPETLSAEDPPYDRLTASRAGSYWNLVVPYALASGFFPASSPDAEGVVHYVLAHGSRLLGVPRADAHIVYANKPYGSGLAPAYGLSMSRFLADNDQPDQLGLSLYGMLAIGMTQGTYISGEAVSVVPVLGAYYRRMYMPPNSGANASFLETLRLMLVHERRGPRGEARGLDLAFSTPRAWLLNGRSISVNGAPTSFGPVSYSITRRGARVDVHLTAPPRARIRLRLRLPVRERIRSVVSGPRRLRFVVSTGTIDLRGRAGPITLRATIGR